MPGSSRPGRRDGGAQQHGMNGRRRRYPNATWNLSCGMVASRDGSCIKMARAGGENVENVRLHARNQETAGICDEFRDWEWSSAGVNLAPEIAGFG
jgi:hypothetical protein